MSSSDSDIIKFRAGTCDYVEETGTCMPKLSGGLVTIRPSDEAEGFYEFLWQPAKKGGSSLVDSIELILIPGETRWIHLKSCKEGRVFCLLFSSGQKYFFWLQEKHQDSTPVGELSSKDKEIVEKIESCLKGFPEEEGEDEEGEDLDEDVAMGDAEPTVSAAKSHDANSSGGAEDQQQQAPQESQPRGEETQPKHVSHIADFLTNDAMINYIGSLDEGSPELVKMYAFLPEKFARDKATLLKCIQSPFFAQSVNTLSANLNENVGGLAIANALGYPYSGEGVLGFLQGARKQALTEKEAASSSEDAQDQKMSAKNTSEESKDSDSREKGKK